MTAADTVSFPAFAADADARLRGLCDAHYAFLYRSLRRLGVTEGKVEDAAQQVLLVAARRLDSIREGSERAFLFGVALRTASDVRRADARRREVHDDALIAERRDPGPGPDATLDEARARRLLDQVLERLPIDLRAVFVLADLEEMTMAAIAEAVGIPPGTVASRLRRARALFTSEASALRRAFERESE